MPLKPRYATRGEIPAEHQPFYLERASEENGVRQSHWHLDAEGLVEKSRLDEFRANNNSLRKELDELKQQFAGVDPRQFHDLVRQSREFAEKEAARPAEIEQAAAERARAIQEQAEERAHDAEQARTALLEELTALQLRQGVLEAASKRGLLPTAAPDLMTRARQAFKRVDGAVIALQADGQTPALGDDGKTPMTFDEWVKAQALEAPHLFENLAGGGAAGSSSSGTEQKNPFRKGPEFNLTEQMKLIKTNPRLAERLRAAC